MLHIIKHADWLLKEVKVYYPAWRDRTPDSTPYHLHGYSCGCSPSNFTGGPYRGWDALRGSERLLHGDPMMQGPALWHPAWRLWEKSLAPGWTRELEEICDHWRANGRTVTPAEMGVPAELHDLCAMTAAQAKSAISERAAA
jgi:hypothetical protein